MKRLTQGYVLICIMNALERGASNILVSTVDTDVIVLLISVYFQLDLTINSQNSMFGSGLELATI